MEVGYKNLLPLFYGAALDPAYTDPADIFVIVDRGNKKLKRCFGIALRRGNMFEYRIEKRAKVGTLFVRRYGSGAVTAGTEKSGAFELFVIGIEVDKEFEYFIHDLVYARICAVDLVDNHNDLVVQLQSLLKHKARLGHGSLRGINEENYAVDHFEYTLNLAAEIGVPGGIDNVYLYVLVVDRRVFGKYGYAAFAFERVVVHDTVLRDLVFAEHAALFEHFIDKRRFAVVDMRDNGDIS